MFKKIDQPIVNHPYPTCGGSWRLFDGKEWKDCDRNGVVKNRGLDD